VDVFWSLQMRRIGAGARSIGGYWGRVVYSSSPAVLAGRHVWLLATSSIKKFENECLMDIASSKLTESDCVSTLLTLPSLESSLEAAHGVTLSSGQDTHKRHIPHAIISRMKSGPYGPRNAWWHISTMISSDGRTLEFLRPPCILTALSNRGKTAFANSPPHQNDKTERQCAQCYQSSALANSE
jgi:hypothetical protein